MTDLRAMMLKPLATEREAVQLPEFGEGVSIWVHGMTAKERGEFERQFQRRDGKTRPDRVQEFRERLLIATCRDDDGKHLFTLEDIKQLSQQRVTVVDRVVNAARKLTGLGDNDVDELLGN